MINLSKPQKSIYNMEKFAGGAVAVICSSMLRIGDIDISVLQNAVNELFRFNSALRTRIAETADGVQQSVSDYTAQEFEVLKFSSQAEFTQYAENFAKQPIDMYGCLCDVKIVFVENKYGLLARLHHIIGDAWTMSLLGKQFATILDGTIPEAYPYSDYLQAESEYIQGKRYQKDKQFFVEQFKKCDEVTYLSDKQDEGYVAERKTFTLTLEMTKQIKDIAEANNSSIFAIFMTLFSVYFSRVKMNTEKFYIGTPVLNRTGIKEQNTVGMFINTVPMLAEINYEGTFSDNLQTATDTIMSLLRHQRYNYEDLLSELRKEYSFTEKLYDVILSYQNARTETEAFETKWYPCGTQTESLQIHIDDRDSKGTLTINYDYRTDKLTAHKIERMHEHIFNLFSDAINHSDKKIYELEILSDTEKYKLLYEFNNTTAYYPKDKCIHQLFEEQVLKTPNKTAVIASDATLTYDELNKLSNRIANALIDKGIGVGDVVAFALPRTSYLIAVMFGILKSGAAYMPIDPDYPQDRKQYLLDESRAKLYIISDVLDELLKNDNIANPVVTITQKDKYCALHTSGSTGMPKLSLLTHRNIFAFWKGNQSFFEQVDISVSVTIVTFDAFTIESVLSITDGIPLRLATEEEIYNQNMFEKMFESYTNILTFSTPTKMRAYIDNSKTKKFLSHIKSFVIGGEVFTEELYQLIRNNSVDSNIFNCYGPTETTICSAVSKLNGTDITIGKPTLNTQMYIVDKYHNPMPTGYAGELCIAGDGVGAGYLNRPEITAEKFVDNPFLKCGIEYPKDKCIHQLFEEQVSKTPDKSAVIDGNQILTYNELNNLSNRIANAIIQKGIGAGDIVAFALPRTSNLIATMFGILKTGAAYMPVDPTYPQERIDYMLCDSNAKLCVYENTLGELLKSENTQSPNIIASFESPCYYIYTSGSTGKSKAVEIKHSNLIHYIYNLAYIYGTEEINMPFFTNQSVDLTITSMYFPLVTGGKIYVYNEDLESDLKNILHNEDITIIKMTPTHMNIINALIPSRILTSVKHIIIGGENLSSEIVKTFLQKFGSHIKVHNEYGPTEATVGCGDYVYNPAENTTFVSIGHPFRNVGLYITDKYNHIMPTGHIGELCIAGNGVGAGYLNRPELTAEKFVDSPFSEGKMYKTGDLAYWREDGNIMFVGRNDFQVKIRGLRIELGEIENAICSTDGVSQAVVVVRKDESGRQLICAFYTEKTMVDITDIKKNISDKLPKYMMPHIFTRLYEMPLTPSGKINRKALPTVDLTNITSNAEYVKPQTELQRKLTNIVETVIGISPIGLNDDFFDIGGDSLEAIEYVSKAHNESIYFNLQAVFDNPTVAELCEYIENGDKTTIQYDEAEFVDINAVLSKNTVDNISTPRAAPVGNTLFAGATGYLGIHILADFLDNDSGIAYCLVRGEDRQNSENRLKELLNFYFGEKYSDLIGTKIKVLCADLTRENFGLSANEHNELMQNVNTVINAAASVKHYGSYQYFYETNVETVKRLIEFCTKSNARLIHTSTLSVSGNSFGDEFDGYISETEKHFYESSLYIGQPLENVYARSKFEAEKEVLSAMKHGLKANIMRMGNLTNRFLDGKFQINYETNAFAKHMKAMLEFGVFPDYMLSLYAEFTPIDKAANAIMIIIRHFSDEQTVFHINSTKIVYFDRLLRYFDELGINISVVNGKEFAALLRDAAKQANTEYIFETFINYMDENEQLNYDSKIRIENDFTEKYLKNLGFEWSDIEIEYIRKYVNYFRGIGYLGV